MNRKILLISPSVLLLFLFAIAPLFIMVYFSLLSDTGAFTLENYTKFFSKDFYLLLTWKTIRLSLLVTLICILIGYPLAYIIAKLIQKGKNMLLVLLVIPLWTSQLLRAYSWFNLLIEDGVLQFFLGGMPVNILYTQTAVILSLVHIFLPIMVITIYMSLEKLDDSLLEASHSLGATSLETFRRIILPLSKPGIIAGSILVFVPSLGVFVEPRILGGVNGSVIGTVIEDQFFEIHGWNFGAAIAVILLLIVVLSIVILNRFNRERVEEG
ncbi:ABC transporter permease [Sporosarcina sp. HYO08]|uniref:ABC transporter permease n=1 Tax=Sporosarcina sp. HYO08 TaxID=1759557 RepID=UPI00079AAEE6|nr:ABC transporter permease [Sporosarcina sp. HYO08]KXH87010.1 ABC transporter permease [Sporosarcina sp. HYO08]